MIECIKNAAKAQQDEEKQQKKEFPNGEYCCTCVFYTEDYNLEEDEYFPMCGCSSSEHFNDYVPADCSCHSWSKDMELF